MKKISQTWPVFLLCFLAFTVIASSVQAQTDHAQGEQSIMVGRVSHIEGTLLRYVPDEQDWIAVVKDAPFGLNDAIYSEEAGRGEFIMPNETWIRIGGNTQIQLIAADPGVTEIDVASGTARFYNKSADGVIKATTPFGYVMVPPSSCIDILVGNDSVEVMAVEGRADFVHNSHEARYEVNAGSMALLADSREVTSTQSYVDAKWDEWNRSRDALWSERAQVAGDSVEYLPPALQHDAYTLNQYGRWESVNYEGANRYFWRPVRVASGWAPFTLGRWSVWYGDNCWIPSEPFGYITHHYGSWVLVGGLWYWAPPVARVGYRVGPPRPLLPIPFAWYPGRVAWIHSGVRVGWIPLAPFEPFYARRMWGPRVVVVHNVAAVNINLRGFRYLDRAIIVNQSNFYRANTYRNVRVVGLNDAALIRDFRPAPVIDHMVIRNYNKDPYRFNFTNVRVARKPHQIAVDRIRHNEAVAQRSTNITARSVRENVGRARLSTPVQGVRIPSPKVTAKMVPADQVKKPVNQIKFQQREIKGKPTAVGPRSQPAAKQGVTGPPAAVKQAPKSAQQPIRHGSQQQVKPQKTGTGKQMMPPGDSYGEKKRTQPGQGVQVIPYQQLQQMQQQKQKGGAVKPGQQQQSVSPQSGKQKSRQPQSQFQPGSQQQGKSQPTQGSKRGKAQKGQQFQPPSQTSQSAPAVQSGQGKRGGQKKSKSPAEPGAEQRPKQGSKNLKGQQKPQGESQGKQGPPGWPRTQ